MQTTPADAPSYRRTLTPDHRCHGEGTGASRTPAERIALSIALLNRGLDLMDEFARTSLARCTRGALRGQHASEQSAPRP